ncbi:UvrD-helicase domain-containing protein [Sodalis ligni]|nr:UvrD-helicase domain-containing protein [Sodalis ligni]
MFLTHLPNDINTEQRAAITTTEGAVRVIAGAGTGKPALLSNAIAIWCPPWASRRRISCASLSPIGPPTR